MRKSAVVVTLILTVISTDFAPATDHGVVDNHSDAAPIPPATGVARIFPPDKLDNHSHVAPIPPVARVAGILPAATSDNGREVVPIMFGAPTVTPPPPHLGGYIKPPPPPPLALGKCCKTLGDCIFDLLKVVFGIVISLLLHFLYSNYCQKNEKIKPHLQLEFGSNIDLDFCDVDINI
jgi:hypothetical protein